MKEPVKLPVHLRPVLDDDVAGRDPAPNALGVPERARDGRLVYAPFSEEKVPSEALPLWRALVDVRDPELPISIVDMGLVYDVRREGVRVTVDLTFTALGCPCMAFIRQDVEDRLLEEEGVTEVEIREVWDPAWTRGRMTEEGKRQLRALGVAA